MPTEFVAQNGAEIHETTKIEVTGCSTAISIVSHTIKKKVLTLAVSVPSAGKLTATGRVIAISTTATPLTGSSRGQRSFQPAPVAAYSSTRACISAFRSSVGSTRL